MLDKSILRTIRDQFRNSLQKRQIRSEIFDGLMVHFAGLRVHNFQVRPLVGNSYRLAWIAGIDDDGITIYRCETSHDDLFVISHQLCVFGFHDPDQFRLAANFIGEHYV